MSLNLNIKLSEQDLDYFRNTLTDAQQRAAGADEADIIDHARTALEQIDAGKVTSFVRDQLKNLRIMVEMLDDSEWPLEEQERLDVVSALAYFYRAGDAVPDEVPMLGLIGLDYAYGFDRVDVLGRPAPSWNFHFRFGNLF